MRTSRISRETARLVKGLAPPTPPPAPRSSTSPSLALRRNYMYKDTTDADENVDGRSTAQSRKRKRGSEGAGMVAARTSTGSATTTTLEQNEKPKKQQSNRRQPAKRKVSPSGTVRASPPSDWEEVYAQTMVMRKRLPAPVDTMGCSQLADRAVPAHDQRFQTLVSLMLSSQTKDTVTAVAVRDLQARLPGGLTLRSVLDVDPDRLNELIGKVGFHNTKTKNIKLVAGILRDRFDGDIPDTIEGLMSLPGVGPKMAYLCMSSAWGRDEGIGVDVHVHRITNLWGWHKTKTPEETRAALQAWLPREKWHEINWLLVGFGQTVCLPVGRKCGECGLAQRGLCPSSVGVKKVKREVKTEAKREIKIEKEDDDDGVDFANQADVEVVAPIKAEVDIEDAGHFVRRSTRKVKLG